VFAVPTSRELFNSAAVESEISFYLLIGQPFATGISGAILVIPHLPNVYNGDEFARLPEAI
jgi:hypothetical protein